MSVKNRGFGSMSPARRSEVGKKGGDSAVKKGVGHRWSSSAAKAASLKGLEVRRKHKVERESDIAMRPNPIREDHNR